jgi:hypothetical protein
VTRAAHIDIGKDYSTFVGPRYRSDGEFSGEDFREKLLEPAYLAYDVVVTYLDSLQGYGASFFEEAYGGLVRKYGYDRVAPRLRFVSTSRPYLIEKISRWMREART